MSLKGLKKYQNLITNYFKKSDKVYEDNRSVNIDIEKNEISININEICVNNNDNTGNWHCLECGDNMGDNPRQLCGKGYCYNSI